MEKVAVQSNGVSTKLRMAKYHSKYSALSSVFRYAGRLCGTFEEDLVDKSLDSSVSPVSSKKVKVRKTSGKESSRREKSKKKKEKKEKKDKLKKKSKRLKLDDSHTQKRKRKVRDKESKKSSKSGLKKVSGTKKVKA